jgi:hypothetical protein
MKDLIYAGFAQLSYLDWHKLNIKHKGVKLNIKHKGVKLNNILGKDTKIFNQILTDDYIEMYGGKKKIKKTVLGSGFVLNRPQYN